MAQWIQRHPFALIRPTKSHQSSGGSCSGSLKSVIPRHFNTSRWSLGGKSSSAAGKIRIGHVEMEIKSVDPSEEHLVPPALFHENNSSTRLRHLQWMMTKDLLGQDVLLVGPPGAGSVYRRRLTMDYASLMRKPVEILTLTPDLTESDLKQRRELVLGKEVEFRDQAPVRAAKNGRLLILDGLERCERNVLPTLNNLLENREMHLEDGTFLISPHRHAQLQTKANKLLIPAHPDFRVIALGVPSPPFQGQSLDPPIRSRFQIRRVDDPSPDEMLSDLKYSESNSPLARFCASLVGAMNSQTENCQYGFPYTALNSSLEVLQKYPEQPGDQVLLRAFPLALSDKRLKSMFNAHEIEEPRNAFWNALKSLGSKGVLKRSSKPETNQSKDQYYSLHSVIRIDPTNLSKAQAEFQSSSGHSIKVTVSVGNGPVNGSLSHFVSTSGGRKALSAMVQEHGAGRDLLLVAPKGEGKNALVQQFATKLGYSHPRLFALNSEMSSQDLLLRRATDQSGQTKWEPSPLLQAAKDGEICILDGIEKLRSNVLLSLQSLAVDRHVSLPNGQRAIREELFQTYWLQDENALSIHPSFRIVALGSLSNDASSGWINADIMTMFSTICLEKPSAECYKAILKRSNPDCPERIISSLLHVKEQLSDSVAEECGVAPLSTRNLIRAIRQFGPSSPNTDLYTSLISILLADLLPPSQRSLLESTLANSGIEKPKEKLKESPSILVTDAEVIIGSFRMNRQLSSRPEMVPMPHSFFDIPGHIALIRDLLRDWNRNERAVLLLGNQGVGKNMVVDRICQIANFEREYLQLHRDSTIGQLTLQPALEDGRIVWRDSPLVRAVRDGSVLVIDEVDKAPIEVITVMKSLAEDGELLLADGRRISRHSEGNDVIPIHPDFSLWLLANRPGYPFHGNNFFREIGDCFATWVVQNPDLESEVQLLQSYAPSVDYKVIHAIASSFSELRRLSDSGDIAYPYSTREAVAVVKHLEAFHPQESVVAALHNVLDFDSFDQATYAVLGKVFQSFGIQVEDYKRWKLAIKREDEASGKLAIELIGEANGSTSESESNHPPDLSMPKRGKWDAANEPHVGGNQWEGGVGGSDTAGLGGRGGPYRMDRGHKIHQVSDEAKAQVNEESRKAAQAMAKAALREKLQEIQMSNTEWNQYTRLRQAIENDVTRLRSMLNNFSENDADRGWIKRQSYGEFDETKLIDGALGDKYIYKRRGKVEDSTLVKKKRLRFVLDCSGSMYRFNSYDERLVRMVEACLLVMESFHATSQTQFEYSIVGHSGDSPCIPLVDWSNRPQNESDKMKILQEMIAHSQYCMSGDYTVEAIGMAIRDVAETSQSRQENESCIVIGVSDANLARYGIHPRQLGKIIEAGERKHVKAHCIFIASFGDEAQQIKESLPLGRAHICLQTSDLPRTLRGILTANLSE